MRKFCRILGIWPSYFLWVCCKHTLCYLGTWMTVGGEHGSEMAVCEEFSANEVVHKLSSSKGFVVMKGTAAVHHSGLRFFFPIVEIRHLRRLLSPQCAGLERFQDHSVAINLVWLMEAWSCAADWSSRMSADAWVDLRLLDWYEGFVLLGKHRPL